MRRKNQRKNCLLAQIKGKFMIRESHLKRHPQEMEQGAGWLEKGEDCTSRMKNEF
ncbi:hypothetical protein Syun_001836 [Stephania yunnanensis]|uniref:Uncharacterized protein n=1 Tax=Stephania yunnanensis TaxID=152371 RepID=A0AAP0LEU8_9MAGN